MIIFMIVFGYSFDVDISTFEHQKNQMWINEDLKPQDYKFFDSNIIEQILR